jgi:anaerobic magnesium-protoporphyrin IX monomethyl ester cyclase
MFKGTYSSSFYRKLQKFVHKEFRKNQGIETLKLAVKNPAHLNFQKLKAIAKLGYYLPSAYLDSISLKLSENES